MSIIIFTLIILLFSVMIHEIAHGGVAYYLGDPTAKFAGRLTLNPLKHLDPLGSVVLPLLLVIMGSPLLIGWAKPVPINPYNFKNQKWDSAKVALAGPSVNILIAFIFGISTRFLPLGSAVKSAIVASFFTGNPEVLSGLFQGSFVAQIFFAFVIITILNLLLAIFNLVPIPPLDGSHILFSFLPEKYLKFKIILQQYGFFFLIFFIFFGGLRLLFLGVNVLFYLICGV